MVGLLERTFQHIAKIFLRIITCDKEKFNLTETYFDV